MKERLWTGIKIRKSRTCDTVAWVTAVAQIQSLAWEFSHTAGAARKKKKKKSRKKETTPNWEKFLPSSSQSHLFFSFFFFISSLLFIIIFFYLGWPAAYGVPRPGIESEPTYNLHHSCSNARSLTHCASPSALEMPPSHQATAETTALIFFPTFFQVREKIRRKKIIFPLNFPFPFPS